MSLTLTGGHWNQRRIQSPKGEAVRPTTGRVRQSLFAKFAAYWPGAKMLDGFAGSGVMGFEALSRGAESVLAIEKNPRHAQVIRANAQSLGLDSATQYTVRIQAIEQACKQLATSFDVIYLDAPYGYAGLASITEQISKRLAPEGLLLIEQGQRDSVLSHSFNRTTYQETLRYGDTVIGVWLACHE